MTDAKPPRAIFTTSELAWPRRWMPVLCVICLAMFIIIRLATPGRNRVDDTASIVAFTAAVASGFVAYLVHFALTTEPEYVRELANAALNQEIQAAFDAKIAAAVAAEIAAKRRQLGLPAPSAATEPQ